MKSSFFKQIYQDYWSELCQKIRSKFGNGPPDPEDIAQQAFMRFFNYSEDQCQKNPHALIYTIAKNLVMDSYRDTQKQNKTLDSIFSELELAPLAEVSAEQAIISQAKIEHVNKTISKLEEKQQILLFGTRVQGHSYQYLSNKYGYSISDIFRTLEKTNRELANSLREWNGQQKPSPLTKKSN